MNAASVSLLRLVKAIPNLVIFVLYPGVDAESSWEMVGLYQLHNIGIVLTSIDTTTHVGGELCGD